MTALLISYFGFVLMMLWMIMVCLMYPEPREIGPLFWTIHVTVKEMK